MAFQNPRSWLEMETVRRHRPPRTDRTDLPAADLQHAVPACCNHSPHLLRNLIGTLVATIFVAGAWGALAISSISKCSSEGFSESSRGLPEYAADAWNATVLIDVAAVVEKHPPRVKLKTRKGAGVVLRVLDDPDHRRSTAHVVTNAHILWFGRENTKIRVGFSKAGAPDQQLWSDRIKLLAVNQKRDLAFLEVRIPKGAAMVEPRLADPACMDRAKPGVVSVGWPNLSRRKEWGVPPPGNLDRHVKRYSLGGFRCTFGDYRLTSLPMVGMDRVSVVFHDADVLPGSSGGPLINTAGEIVGINTLVVGNSENTKRRYCALTDGHRTDPGWAHLAISAKEVLDDYARIVSREIRVNGCEDPTPTADQPAVALLLTAPEKVSPIHDLLFGALGP